ncbi:MAG: GAF domain-containing protein [Armatimonadetes bacterium]|nr:GAF domain-containing protein [Armatimonadota bacterium]NOG94079.1 GAF domain-containing protein [Armatimonadota bacterium]
MVTPAIVRNLLSQALFSRDPVPVLYEICAKAVELTGGRNAMVALYNEGLGYMTLRAGFGKEWMPSMLGERINVGEDEGEGITAFVAATGKSYVTGDVRKDTHYKRLIETSVSELASPIVDSYGRVRGVVNVESPKEDYFLDEHREVLELLAMIAGVAEDREMARVREEALLKVGTALDVAKTEEELLERVAEVTQHVIRVNAYSIFLWDEVEQAFVLKDTVGSSTLSPDAKYKPGEGATGWVCQHGEPIRLEDPSSDPRWRGKHLEFPIEEIKAYIAVPILSRGRSMGCMRAIRKLPKNRFVDNRFTQDEENLLMAIAEQLGTGIEKIRSLERLLTSERMAAWGELSARSSHMIGNRVFALAGDVNELRHLVGDEPFDREAAKRVVDDLQSGLRRIEEILQDFRDFVTATKLSKSLTDVNALIRETVEGFKLTSPSVQINLELDESLEPFEADSSKLERAVGELVENSLHFVDHGSITVRTRRATAEDFAEAGWSAKQASHVRIEVEDTGPGIPVGAKSRIFDAYHSSRAKGMGLGLSIVKGVAEAHGGIVYENGEVGAGAHFVILLPMRLPKPAKETAR